MTNSHILLTSFFLINNFIFYIKKSTKKCAVPKGTTHEKRRAPFAATQFFNIQTGNAKMENAFLPMVKTIPCLEKILNCVAKLSYHPTPTFTTGKTARKSKCSVGNIPQRLLPFSIRINCDTIRAETIPRRIAPCRNQKTRK